MDDGEGREAVIGPSSQRQARSLSVKSVETKPPTAVFFCFVFDLGQCRRSTAARRPWSLPGTIRRLTGSDSVSMQEAGT